MKLFSIFLLVSFTLVLTPKTWWHHCEHSAHAKKSAHAHKHTFQEDCPVCDLSLSVFTTPSPLFLQKFNYAPFVHKELLQRSIIQRQLVSHQLRAPPLNRV